MKRYHVEKEEFTRRANELGAEVLFAEANNDEEAQITQFNELLSKGINILVLDPVNRFNAAQIVRKAHENGIKVISYDRLISNCDVDAYVTFDAQMIGRQMTEYAMKLKPEGNYIILGGDKADINAIGIDIGQQKAIESSVKSGKIKVSYSMFLEKWSADEAAFEVKKFIQLSNSIPDVILAGGDNISKGSVLALIDLNLQGKVIITGNGGEVYACNYIMKGYQTMTVYKPVKKLALLAAELADNMLKGIDVSNTLNSKLYNGTMDVPSCMLTTIPVDASNVRSTVLADGMVTEEELK
jgi:D-xylose transport system substrate-binding protein